MGCAEKRFPPRELQDTLGLVVINFKKKKTALLPTLTSAEHLRAYRMFLYLSWFFSCQMPVIYYESKSPAGL